MEVFIKITKILSLSVWCVLFIGLSSRVCKAQKEEDTIKTVIEAFKCSENLAVKDQARLFGKIEQAYATLKGMSANFNQVSYLAALDDRELSSGKVWLESTSAEGKEVKMRWDYIKPEPQVFLIRGSNVWFYQELDKQVLVDNLEKLLISDAPVSFLLGIGKLHKSFKMMQACRVGKDRLALKLVESAGDAKGQLDFFVLLIDSATYLPVGADVVDVSANETVILFDEIDTNPKIPNTVFNPEWNKGVDVIDRRSGNF